MVSQLPDGLVVVAGRHGELGGSAGEVVEGGTAEPRVTVPDAVVPDQGRGTVQRDGLAGGVSNVLLKC